MLNHVRVKGISIRLSVWSHPCDYRVFRSGSTALPMRHRGMRIQQKLKALQKLITSDFLEHFKHPNSPHNHVGQVHLFVIHFNDCEIHLLPITQCMTVKFLINVSGALTPNPETQTLQ